MQPKTEFFPEQAGSTSRTALFPVKIICQRKSNEQLPPDCQFDGPFARCLLTVHRLIIDFEYVLAD